MKKSFFLKTWAFIGILLCVFQANSFAQDIKKLPEGCKEAALTWLGFYEPLEIDIPKDILINPPYAGYKFSDIEKRAKVWLDRLLIPEGYVVKSVKEKKFREGFSVVSYAVNRYSPNKKSELLVRHSDESGFHIAFANRELESIDYVNEWNLTPVQKVWSFTFTYGIKPLLPGLPTIGPWKGKGTGMLNPSTGKWECVVESFSFEVDLGTLSFLQDGEGRGIFEYTSWIEKNYKKLSPQVSLPSKNEQEGRTVEEGKPVSRPPVSIANKSDELANIPAKTEEEFKKFMSSENIRIINKVGLLNFQFDQLYRKAKKANEEKKWQEVINAYGKILQLDPEYYCASYMMANAYNGLNQPDKAIEFAVKGLQKFPYNLLYAITAEAYSKKGDKNKALLWLEGAFKGGFKCAASDLNEGFFSI